MVVLKRRRIEELFVEIVTAGQRDGTFQVEDVDLSTRMLLDMTRSLASWYRPDGRLDADEILRAYAGVALLIVGATPEAGGASPRRRPARGRQ